MPAANKRTRAYAFLLISTLLWGAAFVVVDPAFQHTTPYLFLFYRFAIASLIVTPFLFHALKQHRNQMQIIKIVGIELIGTVIGLALLYEGLARSTAIETSLLAMTSPLFIIIACILFLHEKQTRKEWLGFAISISGVLLIALLPLLNGKVGLSGVSIGGNLLILLALVNGAVYAVLAKKYYKKVSFFFVTAISFWLGMIVFGLLSWFASDASLATLVATMVQDWQQPSVIFASVYMAIFGSIIAATLFLKGQNLIEASEASLFTYLQPLVYLPLGLLVLGENISPYQLLGLALILVGVGISELRR